MKDKKFLIITIIFVILFIAFISWRLYNYSPPENISNVELIKEINNLERKIDKLSYKRDSLWSIVDTAKVEVIKIHEEYNKVRTNIIYQPLDSDIVFFTRYVSEHEGLLNSDNTQTIKGY